MKKLLLALGLSLFIFLAPAQTTMYFKGEWTRMNKTELFTGIFKINIDADGMIKGELLWTFLSTDETDAAMVEHYKGKKGMRAIEFVEGSYTASTHDMHFEGQTKRDPNDIIGTDKYSLKLSADKKVLYGRTDDNGTGEGMFYAVQVDGRTVDQQIGSAKATLKK